MILTVGHSAHPAADFARLLAHAEVELLVDVRRYPGSRRNPQFRREELERWLPPKGVAYSFAGDDLGGQRPDRDRSDHVALEPGLASYADHMASAAFRAAARSLIDLGADRTIALMCAEADPAQCHRWLLSDALVLLLHAAVSHLLRDGSVSPHVPSPAARVEDGRLIYDVAVDRPLPFD